MSKFRNYEKYEVFEDGRIWSYSRKKFLKPTKNKRGYLLVGLTDNEGNRKKHQLHRVVYEAVTGEPILEGMQCNHISEDKMDCSFANINLMSPKQNSNWGTRNKRMAKALSKQVGAFNKNGELVMVFQSTMEAQRNGFHSGCISMCCNGKLKTHKGFEWRYL